MNLDDRIILKYFGEFNAKKKNRIQDSEGVPMHKMLLLNPKKYTILSK